MNPLRPLLGAALVLSIAACDRAAPPAPAPEAPAPQASQPPAAAAAKPKSKNLAVPVLAGQTVSGKYTVAQAGSLSAFGIRIGNYRNKADGALRLTLCSDGRCQEAEKSLADSKDNDYLMFSLPRPVAVTQGTTFEFTLARSSADPRNRVAVWTYPVGPGQHGLVDPSGTLLEMAPRISARVE